MLLTTTKKKRWEEEKEDERKEEKRRERCGAYSTSPKTHRTPDSIIFDTDGKVKASALRHWNKQLYSTIAYTES